MIRFCVTIVILASLSSGDQELRTSKEIKSHLEELARKRKTGDTNDDGKMIVVNNLKYQVKTKKGSTMTRSGVSTDHVDLLFGADGSLEAVMKNGARKLLIQPKSGHIDEIDPDIFSEVFPGFTLEGVEGNGQVCVQVLCCGSDGITYPTPCNLPSGVTCVHNNQCDSGKPLDIEWVYGMDAVDKCVAPGAKVNFKWDKGHNVVTVDNEANYDACTGFTKTADESGPYTWTAPAADGTFFFICGVGNHCSKGNMKAKIEVSSKCAAPTGYTENESAEPETEGEPRPLPSTKNSSCQQVFFLPLSLITLLTLIISRLS